jgi:hypothetical protein
MRYEGGLTLEQARRVEVGDVIVLHDYGPLKVIDGHKLPPSTVNGGDTPRSMVVRTQGGLRRLLIVTAQSETLSVF